MQALVEDDSGRTGDLSLTVTRAVALLDFLQRQNGPVPLRQITEGLGLSRTAVFRLISTLEQGGLVQRFDSPRGYGLGWKVAVYANALFRNQQHLGVIQEALDTLVAASGETAAVHMRSGSSSICVASRDGTEALVHRIPIGRIAALSRGGAGKAVLAFLDAGEVAAVLKAAESGPRGPNPGTSPADLPAELALIRRSGLAISSEETVANVNSLASPLFGGKDRAVIGSLSLSGPMFRLPVARMASLAPALRQVAASISLAFGCPAMPVWENVGPVFPSIASAGGEGPTKWEGEG